MKPILSILIPTRGRAERLIKSMESFRTAMLEESYEFRVKIDDDDFGTLERIEEIKSVHPNVTIYKSPRRGGWGMFNVFCTEMAADTESDWLLLWNDDATWFGLGLDETLKQVPLEGFVAMAEFHRYGPSTYHKDQGGPFPIVPNKIWEKFGMKEIPFPPDTGFWQLLIHDNHWQHYWLMGHTFWHDRDNDSKISEYRK